MNQILEICHCGHAKDTHHPDLVMYKGLIARGQCLGLGCNVPRNDWDDDEVDNFCPFYRDRTKPDPWKPLPVRPDHIDHCRCYACKQALGIIPP